MDYCRHIAVEHIRRLASSSDYFGAVMATSLFTFKLDTRIEVKVCLGKVERMIKTVTSESGSYKTLGTYVLDAPNSP